MSIIAVIIFTLLVMGVMFLCIYIGKKSEERAINAYWDEEIRKNPHKVHEHNMHRANELNDPVTAKAEAMKHLRIIIQETNMHSERMVMDYINEKYTVKQLDLDE